MTDGNEVAPAGSSRYRFQLSNASAMPVSVRPSVENSQQGWTGQVLPGDDPAWRDGALTIAPGRTVDVMIEVTAPPDARIGDQNAISLRLDPAEGAPAPGPREVGPARDPIDLARVMERTLPRGIPPTRH
jgi:hypothetical protein